MTDDPLRSEFRNPSTTYRGAPFWAWNDRLQVSELTRQVKDMRAHGMGGFFMHSREGLETPYLSPEWMDCICQTVQAAKEAGMNAWLYDEDRWPSGFAGGRVPAAGGDAFRAKLLTLEKTTQLPSDAPPSSLGKGAGGLGSEGSDPPEIILALFAAFIADGAILSARRLLLPQGEPLAPGEVYLVFRRQVSTPSEWFNDDTFTPDYVVHPWGLLSPVRIQIT